MTTTVTQLYKSTDLNAPPLSGQSNSLIRGPLNACLVDGYSDSSISITSITRSSNTATATCSADDILRLQTGNILTISGANQSDYNITAIITVASTTTFTYTVANSPTTPATGTIVFSKKLPITSITKSGTTATVTLNNNNSTLQTGNFVTIEGATGGDASLYNGTFQITVLSQSQFTYTMTSTPSGNATGTLVYYKAGLGWARPFSAGTNSQTYRSANNSTNRFYCQVIDNAATAGGAKEAQIYGAEVMSADQTVTSGQFPTAGQVASGFCIRKSAAASTANRAWTIFGDDRVWYLAIITGDTWGSSLVGCHGGGFGHFVSFKAGDSFNTFVSGGTAFNTAGGNATPTVGIMCSCQMANTPAMNNFGLAIARAFTQTGSAIPAVAATIISGGSVSWGPFSNSNTAGMGSLSYPNAVDNGFYVWPIFICEQSGGSGTAVLLRGRFLGWYGSIMSLPFSNYDQISGVSGLSGVTLTALSWGGNVFSNATGSPGQIYADTFGPWS